MGLVLKASPGHPRVNELFAVTSANFLFEVIGLDHGNEIIHR